MKKNLLFVFFALFCFTLNAQESYKDYLKKIEDLKKELNQIKVDEEAQIRTAKANFESEYKTKLNEIEQKEFPPYEKSADIKQKKEEMREEAKKSFDNNVETSEKIIHTDYNAKFENAKSRLESVKNLFKSIIFQEEKTEVSIGTFEKELDPQYWPIEVKSLSDELNFEWDGKIIFSGVDKEKEWNTIENNRNNFIARLSYVAVEDSEYVFSKRIKKIEIINKTTNGVTEKFDVDLPESPVIKTETIDKSQSKGTETPKPTAKPTTTTSTKNDYEKKRKRAEANEWRSDDSMIISFSGLWGYAPSKNSKVMIEPQFGMDFKVAELLIVGYHLAAPIRFDTDYNYNGFGFNIDLDFGFSFDYLNCYIRLSAFGIESEDDLFEWNFFTPVVDVRIAKWLNLTSELTWFTLRNDYDVLHINPEFKIGISFVITNPF